MATLAEWERALINERTMDGLSAARARGRIGGRKPKMTVSKLTTAQLRVARPETDITELCKELGITRQTLYRHVAPDGSIRPDGQKLLDQANQRK